MIIGAAGGLGLIVSSNYRRRVAELHWLRSGLQMLETEIIYASTPLPEALRRVSNRVAPDVGRFFAEVSSLWERSAGESARTIWLEALEKYLSSSALLAEDAEVLKALAGSLGISDKADQEKNLLLAKKQLEEQEQIAERERGRYEKLWQTLGFLMGIAIVLVMI